MTKTLTLDVTSFKFADNDTDLKFRAMQNGVIISDSTLSATIKIKQVDVGYLKSVSAKWVDKRIVISSGDLSDLPVGSYSLELWLSSSNGYEIYPDSGFVNLYINQNATGISGNLISSITLGEFQQQFSELSKDIMDNLPEGKVGPQGEKGDIGPQGVQGIQGERGERGERGLQGIQGVSGKDFSIAKTFSSVASMSGDGLTTGDFVMISSTVEDPDNAKMYLWNGTEFTPGNWYYWSGTAWTSGGVYQSTGIGDHSISRAKLDFLSLPGVIGKNLFDRLATTLENYISSNSGNMLPLAGYSASDFISVLPSTAYRISGTIEQLAFYDSNKAFISGIAYATSFETTPANVAFVRMSMKTPEINAVQLELGNTITSYEPYTIYFNNESIHSPIPQSKLDPSLIKGAASKNLFDKSRATPGNYISRASGKVLTGAGFSASDYILVSPSTAYRISGTTEQLAFYDINKAYISGLSFGDQITTTPANAAYVRMSMFTSEIGSVQIEKGSTVTSYEAYGYYLNDNSFSKENISMLKSNIFGSKVINVKKDGTGDFTSLVNALNSIKGSSKDSVYDVYIYDDHDMIAELGGQTFIESLNTQANSNRRGVFLPSYVNLHGVNKVRLYGKIDSSWNINYWTVQAISLLEISAGFNFCENITFDAKNMRYAVHDETNGLVPNTTVKWKDCEFIHRGNSEVLSKGNWTSVVGYGMGSSSGTKRYWDNCIFDSAAFYGFSIHDNANFILGTQLSFESCEFYNRAENTSVLEDLKLSTYSTGTVNNLAIINNCILKKIAIINETGLAANRWRVKGSGNTTSSMAEPTLTVPTTIQF